MINGTFSGKGMTGVPIISLFVFKEWNCCAIYKFLKYVLELSLISVTTCNQGREWRERRGEEVTRIP